MTETLVPRPPATPPPPWRLRMTWEWKRSSRPCERWQRGVCELGEACGFSHEVVPAEDLEVEEESEAEDLEVEEESKDDPKADIEAAQDSGKAEYADAAANNHGSDVDDSRPVPPWRPEVQRKLVVCRHWLNNRCTPGKLCRFLHATEEREARTVREAWRGVSNRRKAAAHTNESTVREAWRKLSLWIRVNRIKRELDSGLEEGDEGPSIPSYESYGLVGAGLEEDDGDGGAAVRGHSPPLVRKLDDGSDDEVVAVKRARGSVGSV
jgi:hypothetical protein